MMAAFAPTRLETLSRSSSDARRRPGADSSFLSSDTSEGLRRSRSRRENGAGRPHPSDNDIWYNFEDYERQDAEYRQANALQTRRAFHHRAQSEDTRMPVASSVRSGRVLTPERSTRFDQRPSSDPQTPRFEELTDDLADSLADRFTVVEDEYNTDEYEAPSTLLGQAQDCMTALAQAADKARGQPDSNDSAATTNESAVGESCDDALFRLKVWTAEAKLEHMPAKGDNDLDDEVITLVSSILYRLHARIRSLAKSIKHSKRRSSTSFSFAAPIQNDLERDSSGSENGSTLPSEELPPVAQVEHHLKQIELQTRSLRRLTRSLRVVQKDDFSSTVVKHVAEVTQLFGEREDCEKWKDEVQGMPGDAALTRVKEIAGVCG